MRHSLTALFALVVTDLGCAFVSPRPIAEISRMKLAYRCLSHFFPADPLSKKLAGAHYIKQMELGIAHLQQTTNAVNAQNTREKPAVRHFWFCKRMSSLIAQHNFKQVVFLGTGFDATAYHLPCLQHTNVFEVDIPELIQAKALAIAQAVDVYTRPIANRIARCGIDLSMEDALPALMARGFDHEEPTLWIAEECIYHLDFVAAHKALRLAICTPNSVILFDMISNDRPGTYKHCMNDPLTELELLGFDNVHVDQLGDDNANFGALDTDNGMWAYKYNMQIDCVKGKQLQRNFLIEASKKSMTWK